MQPNSQTNKKFPHARANWITRVVNSDKKVFKARCTDISEGGAQIELDADFQKGDKLLLEIQAKYKNQGTTVRVLGQVTFLGIHNNHNIFGLKFLTDLGETKHFIRSYVYTLNN